MPTECISPIFHFRDLGSGQFSAWPIMYNPNEEITFLPITFEPVVVGDWKWYQSFCLVVPNRMIPNMTHFDLT